MFLEAVNILDGVQKSPFMKLLDALVSQCIDIHGITGSKMNHAFHDAGRTVLIDAVMCGFSRKTYQMTAADRTGIRKNIRFLRTVTAADVSAHHFRNDIPCLTHDDDIMNTKIFLPDHILIMQLSGTHCRAGNTHRLQNSIRRNTPCSSHAQHDIQQSCLDFLCRKFIRCGPARHLDGRSQTCLCTQIIYFNDHSIDFIRKVMTLFAYFLDKCPDFIYIVTSAPQRIYPQMKPLHFLQCFFMRENAVFGSIDEIIPECIQPAGSTNCTVQLPDTSGSSVARIGKQFFSLRLPFTVQTQETCFRHINFTADLDFSHQVNMHGNALNGTDIVCYIFAYRSIAAGHCL